MKTIAIVTAWLSVLLLLLVFSACAESTSEPAVTPISTLTLTPTPTFTSAAQVITITYEANLSKVDSADTDDVMNNVMQIIKRRLNDYGITKPIVQQRGNNQILVQLSGVKDINEAMKLIGQTGQLDFRVQRLDAQGTPVIDENGNFIWDIATGTGEDGREIELTGQYLKGNAHINDAINSRPEIAIEWKGEAAPAFEQVTTMLVSGNKPLGIFLDDELISAPRVQTVLSDKAIITGLSLDEAKILVIQLNLGALPVPLKVISNE